MEIRKHNNPNYLPDRIELLEADLSWWLTFFEPAIKAYHEKDDKKLKEMVNRYNEFNGIK